MNENRLVEMTPSENSRFQNFKLLFCFVLHILYMKTRERPCMESSFLPQTIFGAFGHSY